jgi:hypothetical protein
LCHAPSANADRAAVGIVLHVGAGLPMMVCTTVYMPRRLLNFATVTMLVLAVGITSLWAVGSFCTLWAWTQIGNVEFHCRSVTGEFRLAVITRSPYEISSGACTTSLWGSDWPDKPTRVLHDLNAATASDETWCSFEKANAVRATYIDGSAIEEHGPAMPAYVLSVRLWPLAALCAVPALIRRVAVEYANRRRRIRLQEGLCVRCGYDLRASPDRCPECGNEPSVQLEPPKN